MAEDSAAIHDAALIDGILPLADGVIAQLEAGIDVADIGCGRGHAVNLMAKAFPNSRFTGFDFSAEGVKAGAAEAKQLGLTNATFVEKDVSDLGVADAFDFITAFDAIHDQAKPADVLAGIAKALRPGGTLLMVDIRASSHVHENVEHPLGPFLYTASTMHCMTVSLALGGAGLGTAWGEQLALSMLTDAVHQRRHQAHRRGHRQQLLHSQEVATGVRSLSRVPSRSRPGWNAATPGGRCARVGVHVGTERLAATSLDSKAAMASTTTPACAVRQGAPRRRSPGRPVPLELVLDAVQAAAIVAAYARYGLQSAPGTRHSTRRSSPVPHHAERAGAIVLAPHQRGRRPGTGLEPLVRVDVGREAQRQLARDSEQAAQPVVGGVAAVDRRVQVTRRTHLVHRPLGHERDRPVVQRGDLLYAVLVDGVAVGHLQRLGVDQVDLVLTPTRFAL